MLRRQSFTNIHGVNIGPIWCRQDPVGPHVGPMKFAIWFGPLDPLPTEISKPA